MELRFYVDPGTGIAHFEHHGVTETEIAEVVAAPLEDGSGPEGSRVAIGQTEAGRFLKVIYVPDEEPGSAFVITAFQPGPKALRALRRRLRRR